MPTRTCPGCGLRLAIAARCEQETIDCPRCSTPLSPAGKRPEAPPKPGRTAPRRERPWAWPRPERSTVLPRGRKWRLAVSIGLLGLLLGTTDIQRRDPGKRPPPIPPAPPLFRQQLPHCVGPNPFPVGTQVRLEPADEYPVPWKPEQLVYSAQHQALFVRSTNQVQVLDLGEGKWRRGERLIGHHLKDMSLAPDESVLFVADRGSEGPGGQPHRVHRFDLEVRRWETRDVPLEAARIEAVDGFHFVLLEDKHGGWSHVTFNRWEANTEQITECSRMGSFGGGIAHDPWKGRLYHAFQEKDHFRLTVYRLEKGKLIAERSWTIQAPANSGANPSTSVLSVDGRRLYLGRVQVDTQENRQIRVFRKSILAASRDLAFGKEGAYDAHTTLPVKSKLPQGTKVYTVSRDGRWLWVFDLGQQILRRFALRGKQG
jgi:hypothetical protein